jgi:hypothetical protein
MVMRRRSIAVAARPKPFASFAVQRIRERTILLGKIP